MTLLSIVQNAADRIGLPRPTAVVSSADQTVRTLYQLAQEEGRSLSREGNWAALTKEGSFTTLAAESQGALTTIASDFDRFINDSMWNRSTTDKFYGPINQQRWQAEKANVSAGVEYYFRVRGGLLIVTPTLTAGSTVYFEYVSNQWCESSGGTDQSAWAADTDVGLLPEELMTLGLVWRYKASRGFSYSDDFEKYRVEVNNALARDGGAAVIDMGGSNPSVLGGRLADGSWSL